MFSGPSPSSNQSVETTEDTAKDEKWLKNLIDVSVPETDAS